MAIVDELIAVLGYDIRGEEKLGRWKRSIDGAEKSLVAFAAAAAKWGAVAGAAVGAGIAYLGKNAIQVSAQFESFEATLTTIEGSAVKAKESMKWIQQFAKETPYELAEVTEAFVRLKSYGIDPMDGSLAAVGDAGSAMGKTIMMGVEALADAATFSFERLKEFGVTSRVEGDKVTFSWIENGKKISQTVEKNGEEISRFLVGNFNRFQGAMLLQSRTWNGMVSNLSDTWQGFLLKIGEAGLFEAVKGRLDGLLSKFAELDQNGTLDKWAQRFSDALIFMLDTAITVFERIVTHGTAFVEWLASLDPSTVQAIGWAFAALAVYLFPVAAAVGAVILALDYLFTYLQGGESIIGKVIEWFGTLGDQLAAIDWSSVGQTIGKGLVDGIVISLSTFDYATLGPIIASGILAGLVAQHKIFHGFVKGIADSIMAVDWAGAWSAQLSLLYGIIEGAAGRIQEIIQGWFDFDLSGAGVRLAMSLFEGMKSVGGAIVAWFDSLLPEWARGFIGTSETPRATETVVPTGDWRAPAYEAPRTRGGVSDVRPMPGGDVQGMLSNMNANLAKMSAESGAGAVITDSRQDNRSFPVSVGVGGVVVNVQSATDAPAATGRAVGLAVGGASVGAVTRTEAGPAF